MRLDHAYEVLESYAKPDGIGFPEVKEAILTVLPLIKERVQLQGLCEQLKEATKNDLDKRRKSDL